MLRLVTLRVYERSLEVPAPPVTLPAGVELVVMDRDHVTADLRDRWHPEAEQRLREGQACVVARHGTEVVAYCWLTRTPVLVDEVGHAVVLAPDEVYYYDAFTVPEWRGRGLFLAVLSHGLALARTWGAKRALIFADTKNAASRRVIERAGFEIVHTVSRVALWRLTRLWFRGGRPVSSRVTLVKGEPRRG